MAKTSDAAGLVPAGRRALAVTTDAKREQRINQFARNNQRLREALAEREEGDGLNATGDLSEMSRYLLVRIIEEKLARPDELAAEEAGNLLRLLRAEEIHQAKVDQLRANTESVLTNVATPTAIRAMLNEFGLCIQRGVEGVADRYIKTAPTEADKDFLRSVLGEVYTDVMAEIARMGQADSSLGRMMAAMK